MKTFVYILVASGLLVGCNTSGTAIKNTNDITNLHEQDTVRIANDDIEYEIIIIEPGFNSWLVSTAQPKGYYSQQYLEGRNRLYVTEWNSRVLQPHNFNPNLYEMRIDYDPSIDYGYEVNYKLYNYFIYFQLTYKQKLTGYVPRI
ncbi:DUF6146 family protein [Aquaticitalea lipolytica]|mgnify:FL=1|uniref:DUF6146 family protein n=1 Tax=Aquaticitalea lipolytica TaxID=1247562 RepID=UPI0024B8B039|nr:DUF6146 family protein [Aquaticitalea lipolytica]